ncbi:MAG: nucleotidyl transferase AbiEii/AbiGii toxin family protein, partial [Spirochaetota bacterium]|nr:nucleotidyl transferase AbiEii/AbiGii toxin family protein [Spirochaetota bacterium]
LDFPILSIPDLYGGKICAALDRQHPRDIFDILLMQETIGYTELIKQALLVYIISHPRPISELLNPNLLDIKEVYGKEFQNMTIRNVTVEDLELVRKQLIKRVNSSLTEQDKLFLLSVKRGKPSWDLHPLHRIQDLPAVQWKLKNILKMNTDKNKEALDKLDAVLFEGNS